ncbi:RadC family protein [Cycloclasticus pugetii]|uniref:RadC family protein n=1 Tax=Cycloclasticus pugetii TaxID=34068 RepID=UPI0024099C34|nr:DNA repair protein RadC [Cycloclasticus pugetii]MDF1830294.1 DNA repair protein RadC [Cycloclasticus pugetii]
MQAFTLNETTGTYQTTHTVTSEQIIDQAKAILLEALQRPNSETMSDPTTVRQFLTLSLADKQREIFACLYLDNQHRLIKFEELFKGTIDSASVYPREVVKAALQHNAAAVIFAHNHPSGIATPSQADKNITQRLKQALATVDIRTLDHFVVGHDETVSFAKKGYL